MAQHSDVVIAGAGMVGVTTANLLARCGFSVTLVERQAPVEWVATPDPDLRVSALSPGSMAILLQAGLWPAISQQRHCAYRRMQVEDRAPGSSLVFDAPAFGLDCLGTIVENPLVQATGWQAAANSALVEIRCPQQVTGFSVTPECACVTLDNGDQITASLLVAADGASSAISRLIGGQFDSWEYNQQGVVCLVGKEQPNPGIAWQRFLAGGPLAFLPLADGRSSIVWTLPAREAELVFSADDGQFRRQLEEASHGWLGTVKSIGPRARFPLSMRLADRHVGQRVVLLGDAAHVVHPLAGQGVNLGLADAAALVEVLVGSRQVGKDLADAGALRAYGRWRKSESEMMARGIHGLKSLFAVDALGPVRRLGLKMVNRSWASREAFVRRAAGLGRNAPRLARGEDLRSLLAG